MPGKSRKTLFFDGDLCISCHSCEIACKMENNLPAGVNRIRIVTSGPFRQQSKLTYKHERIACCQCYESPCLKVCPNGAMSKRMDGILTIDISLCTGCKSCGEACPYGAVQFYPETHIAQICDLCAPRQDVGLPPFCVQHCMSGALFFGTQEDFQEKQRILRMANEDNR